MVMSASPSSFLVPGAVVVETITIPVQLPAQVGQEAGLFTSPPTRLPFLAAFKATPLMETAPAPVLAAMGQVNMRVAVAPGPEDRLSLSATLSRLGHL